MNAAGAFPVCGDRHVGDVGFVDGWEGDMSGKGME